MPGILRQATAPPLPLASRARSVSPLPLGSHSSARLVGSKQGMAPALGEPSKKKKKKKGKKDATTAGGGAPQLDHIPGYPLSSHVVHERWRQPYGYHTNWSVPVKEKGYHERVGTPWSQSHSHSQSKSKSDYSHSNSHSWYSPNSNSSNESLNGWTPWTSWQRAHGKSDPYKGRTFEAVPVESLNLDDNHHPNQQQYQRNAAQAKGRSREKGEGRQTSGDSKERTDGIHRDVYPQRTSPVQVQDDGIRVKAVSFSSTVTTSPYSSSSSYSPTSSKHPTRLTSISTGVQVHPEEELLDSDRSFIESQGLGMNVVNGLMHYPKTPTPSPVSSIAGSPEGSVRVGSLKSVESGKSGRGRESGNSRESGSDRSSVESWSSEWRMRHLC